jgi:hypothetical protein
VLQAVLEVLVTPGRETTWRNREHDLVDRFAEEGLLNGVHRIVAN